MKEKTEIRFRPGARMLRNAPDLELRLSRTPAPVVGRVIEIGPDNLPIVEFRRFEEWDRFAARSTVPVTLDDVGREAVLLFERDSTAKPIIIGLVQPLMRSAPGSGETKRPPDNLVFTAQEEIKFSCGKASMIFTRAGKILLKGTYLLSRSSGVNRIKGGSVQIN